MKFEKHKLEKTRLKFASLQKRFYISFQHHLLLLNFDFHEQTIFIYIYIVVVVQVHGSRQCNIVSCGKYMFREGGIKSYWRGNGINVLKIGPETALKFMAYEQVKRAIKGPDNRELSIYERFVAGSIAGGVSQSAIYPLEVSRETFVCLIPRGSFFLEGFFWMEKLEKVIWDRQKRDGR